MPSGGGPAAGARTARKRARVCAYVGVTNLSLSLSLYLIDLSIYLSISLYI